MKATYGSVHVLVNNSGMPRKVPGEDGRGRLGLGHDRDAQGRVPGYPCIPRMIEQVWGRVINISSRAHLGNPTHANYSAAKAGLIGMAKALAIEEGRYGITVNCVAWATLSAPRARGS